MSRLIDISPPIGVGAPVYPGDTEFEVDLAFDATAGESVTVCRVTLSPHTGAHADAPMHVAAGPGDAASLALEAFWGPCAVVSVSGVDEIGAGEVERALVAAGPSCERLLVRTQERPYARFPESFPHFTAEGARALAARAAAHGGPLRLVGIDTFSVDRVDSKDLPAHRILFAAGIVLLEGLDLSRAEPRADYELAALPLRIVGADASPVRAVLRSK